MSELRQAAEQYREWRRTHELAGRCEFIQALADAYLAEHPADDEEPVTEEWLRSIGFTKLVHLGHEELAVKFGDDPCDCQWIEVTPATFSHGYFNLRRLSDMGIEEEIPADIVSVKAKTRGAVRRLLAALGVEK